MMNRVKQAVVLAAVVVGVSSAYAGTAEYVPGEVIVKYKDGLIRSRESMNTLYDDARITSVRRLKGSLNGFEQLRFNAEDTQMDDVVQTFMKNDAVEYVQPNYILRSLPVAEENVAVSPAAGIPCFFPGFPPGCEDSETPVTRPVLNPAPADVVPPVADPSLSEAYGLSKIGATSAWKANRGSKKIIVAVIDTGVDYNHEDLSFNVWRNPKPTQNDVVGFDFVHNDGLPFDDNKHGTHTSGTVGAVGGNGKGVSGVSQRVSVMAIKFLSGQGSGTTADAIRAVDYAINHGAKVLSNSWGGHGNDNNQALFQAIERAKAKNVLFVAAAGNDGTDNDGSDPAYPAGFTNDNLIAVAATDRNDQMASFSNYGKKTTHLGAPGVGVYSTTPGGQYEALSGTSMACPHVAGAAALIWSKKPTLTYKQVKNILMSTADPVSSLAGRTVTGARLNVLKALAAVK